LGILVKTYGQAGNIDKVFQVWDEMEKQRGLANAVTYGCMIDACVKCNHLNKAIEIFQGMREDGKHRNTILYTTLIKGYGLEKDITNALQLFREMPGEGVAYNTITYNSIIDACVKVGDLPTAESLLREITAPDSPLEPDLITFSTLLKGYCHVGDLDKALQITEAIKARGIRCDELVYNTLMDGCVKANDVTVGVGLFEEMVSNGMRPSAITHSILARLYQRAGYEEDAQDAVAQLYRHHGIERPSGGDRMKGGGRRDGNQRSPLSQGFARPHGSPSMRYDTRQSDCWSWSDTRSVSDFDTFNADQSCVSTPCGSPGRTMGNAGALFLPIESRCLPPLPGMGADTTPYASSCSGWTPMNSAFQGSFASSPCMSPAGMQQHDPAASLGIPASPAQVSPYSQSPHFTTLPTSSIPSLPGAPFSVPNGAMMGSTMTTCTMPGLGAQGSTPGVDGQVPQFFPVQMAQPTPPPVGAMMPPNGMCPMNQPEQQVFFENFAPDGQQVNASAGGAGQQSPFCL
jgi:pentatricopeptide repeat protein